MRIYSEGGHFLPEHFDIFRFYDETLLIAWHGDRLRVFRYNDPDGDGNPRSLLAPGVVKSVQNFSERIFVTCVPYGVYKLSKNYRFALLSSTGIGIGARFYQVLRLEDNYISLGDKQAKTSRLLFKHDPIDGVAPNIIGLIGDSVDDELLSVLLEGEIADRNELCIYSSGYDIYKITSDAVKIIHSCVCPIKNIVEVRKNEKLACLLYVTNKNLAILMYAKNGELIFEKIEMNHEIKTVHACFDEVLDNTIWIVHSNGLKTHKSRKILGKHSLDITELEEQNITCLRNYDSEILGLNSMGELVRVDIKVQENLVDNEDDNYVQLKREMLEGTDSIVEAICEKVKELQSFDNELHDQQSALKRINMVACKQDIPTTPKLKVHKIANKTFLNCKLGYGMPDKCQLSFSVKSGGRKIFSTKRVTENETNIELPLPTSVLSEASTITLDLITLAEEGYSWCLIKNCINDTEDTSVQVPAAYDDKNNFVNAKLAALRNIKIEDRLDIVKLNAIKNSVRKEFNAI